jgi:UDP-glucose 4-epimerase
MKLEFRGMKTLVTGGAGFIASHIVDRLLSEGAEVLVYDNFSTGDLLNLTQARAFGHLSIMRGDVLDLDRLTAAMEDVGYVFHFQANADVRGGIKNTRIDFEQNTTATLNVLEAMRLQNVSGLVFASSAVVYGEPIVFPTPEDISSRQTSLYAASKKACEALIEAYSEYFGFRYDIFRFVSWIGPRYSHGVVVDFVNKLRRNPKELEILGDGNQRKSYLDVADGVQGIFHALAHAETARNIFNLGHEEWMSVLEVAAIVIEELQLHDVKLTFTGGARGWLGDSPFVHLDINRMRALGWRPKIPIAEGIRRTVRHIESRDSSRAFAEASST